MEHQAPLPNRGVPPIIAFPQDGGLAPMRNGKMEEGKAHGEGWAAIRSMALVIAIVAGIAAVFYFGV